MAISSSKESYPLIRKFRENVVEMIKIGKLRRLPDGTYQLRYKGREDLGYQVRDTSSLYEGFKNKEEALRFIRKNNIELEKGGE